MPKYNPLLKCSYFNDARMIFNLFDALIFDFFPLFYEDKLLYTKMGHQSEWHNSLQSYLLLNKAPKKQYHNWDPCKASFKCFLGGSYRNSPSRIYLRRIVQETRILLMHMNYLFHVNEWLNQCILGFKIWPRYLMWVFFVFLHFDWIGGCPGGWLFEVRCLYYL